MLSRETLVLHCVSMMMDRPRDVRLAMKEALWRLEHDGRFERRTPRKRWDWQ